jgi:hypothetical protein
VTWIVQYPGGGPNDPGLYSVDAVSSRLVWISGESSGILHTTNGGGITSVHTLHSEIPTHFELEQNFPNPFNPETRIQFTLANKSKVSLKVFDVLGREVAILVDDERVAGNYVVAWNSSGFSSGVYYYQLHSGTLVATRKMLLIR